MRRRILRLGKGLVVLLLVVVAASWAYGVLPSSQGVGPLSEDLGGVIIPSFTVKEASIREAVAELEKVARAHEPNRHLNVLLWDLPQLPKGFRAELELTDSSAVIPGLEPRNDREYLATTATEPRHSIRLSDIALSELMRYISLMYGCTVGQKESNLYVVQAKGRFGRLEKQVWKVKYPAQFGLSHLATTTVDVRGYFESNGVRFHEGDSAVYYPRSHRLVVRAFQEEIDLVDAILPWECSFRGRPPTAWELAVGWFDYYREKVTNAFYNVVL
jgi:hypothetical protein